jgi:hypothetical protein
MMEPDVAAPIEFDAGRWVFNAPQRQDGDAVRNIAGWIFGPSADNMVLDVLRSALVVRVLQPWQENIGKRCVQCPPAVCSKT